MPDYDYSSNEYNNVDRTHNTNNWNAVFTDKKNNSELDSSDFLKLMIAQLQNQDFMNPMDDTQYVTQMAQFSSVQAMTELANYSKTSYAMGLVGQTVTASRYKVNGDLDTTTGPVEKVSLVNNEYTIFVGGKSYSLDQVMQVSKPLEKGQAAVDPSKINVQYKDVSSRDATFTWTYPTEDETLLNDLTYQVYYSTEGPFDTLDEVTEKGTASGSVIKRVTDESQLSTTISGLTPGTTYYANVVVTDANGNKAIYRPTVIRTKSE